MNNVAANLLWVGDSLSLLPAYPDNSIDLIITSPPYFQQRDYNGRGIGNEATEQAYLDALITIFRECVRITKPTGAIVFNLGDKYNEGGLALLPYKFAIQAIEATHVRLINQLSWVKLNPTPRQDKRKLVQSHEPFFIFSKNGDYYFDQEAFMEHLDTRHRPPKSKSTSNLGKRYFELIAQSDLGDEEKRHAERELREVIQEVQQGKIEGFRMKIRGLHAEPFGGQEGGRKMHLARYGFTIIRILGNRMKRDVIESPVETIKNNPHPAIYPLFVIQQLIKLLSQEGDIVLDPFCGSGTTCVAAKMLRRQYIGIDLSADYITYAQARLDAVPDDVYIQELLL